MRQVAYGLVLLTFWAQFDDVLLPLVLATQSAEVATDDDEYLSCERPEQCAPRRHVQTDSVKHQAADYSSDQKNLSSERQVTGLFVRSPLYVFMSLQI
jgi:hypothetical protein